MTLTMCRLPTDGLHRDAASGMRRADVMRLRLRAALSLHGRQLGTRPFFSGWSMLYRPQGGGGGLQRPKKQFVHLKSASKFGPLLINHAGAGAIYPPFCGSFT